jgi:DNA-binding NarL/FixJ family response regulator
VTNLGKSCRAAAVADRRRRAAWMAGRGWPYPEIARELMVHRRTVERYLSPTGRYAAVVNE